MTLSSLSSRRRRRARRATRRAFKASRADVSGAEVILSLYLDPADKALKNKCFNFADYAYRSVVRIFTGRAFEAARQRAMISIDDIRAVRR